MKQTTGWLSPKQQLKLGLKMGCLLLMGSVGMMVHTYTKSQDFEGGESRHLLNDMSGKDSDYAIACRATGYPPEYDPIVGHGALSCTTLDNGGFLLLIMGILYMFVALAIVCDEFFVPALESLAEVLNLSDDVAGATLMAAGGSAPELFTSFLGVFVAKSDVGFGTIVGSAVFNVLFVIGMCAVFSKDVLVLTWWPLTRDCTYYSISLGMLALFFSNFNDGMLTEDGGSDPKQILWWEALILFLMYFGYVFMMKHNDFLHEKADAFLKKYKKTKTETSVHQLDMSSIAVEVTDDVKQKVPVVKRPSESALFVRPSKFRAGVLHLMISDKPMLETAGVHVVSNIEGDARETFRKLSILCLNADSSPNTMNFEEFKVMIKDLDQTSSAEEVKAAFNAIDADGNGSISEQEFCAWYNTSELRLTGEVHRAFDLIDTNKNGAIDKEEFIGVLRLLEANPTPQEMEPDFAALDLDLDGVISRTEFEKWYLGSIFYKARFRKLSTRSLECAEENAEDFGAYPPFPRGQSLSAKILYCISFPLIIALYSTIPNVSRPKFKDLYTIAFFGSIGWIGIFSYFMVWWATVLGDVIGIPPQIMGLTFLAAGTSVPDLLSSVIVAKQGKGDMAVSSSIGSNIFDILVGLPVPWLLYSIFKGKPQTVQSESLGVSILILLVMLVAVVMVIAASNWRMTKGLGATMFGLYVVFLTQDLLRAV